MTHHVVAIDDHDIALIGVEAVLDECDNCTLVGTFHSATELLNSTTEEHSPTNVDVVLLDLRLSDGSDPYDNVTNLQDAGYTVLVFSSLESPYMMRRALLAGVSGVIQKSQPAQSIADAIDIVAQGNTYASADWASLIDTDPLTEAVNLSERQLEVLEQYAMGKPAKQVATALGLSPDTVQDYLTRIRNRYASVGRVATTKVDMLRCGQEDGYLPGPLDKLSAGA